MMSVNCRLKMKGLSAVLPRHTLDGKDHACISMKARCWSAWSSASLDNWMVGDMQGYEMQSTDPC